MDSPHSGDISRGSRGSWVSLIISSFRNAENRGLFPIILPQCDEFLSISDKGSVSVLIAQPGSPSQIRRWRIDDSPCHGNQSDADPFSSMRCKIYHGAARAWRPAVGAPLERGVRPQRAALVRRPVYGFNDAKYAEMAIMSSWFNLATVSFMGSTPAPALTPVLISCNCRYT